MILFLVFIPFFIALFGLYFYLLSVTKAERLPIVPAIQILIVLETVLILIVDRHLLLNMLNKWPVAISLTAKTLPFWFYVYKSIETAAVVVLYFYCFRRYKRKLLMQKEERLSGLTPNPDMQLSIAFSDKSPAGRERTEYGDNDHTAANTEVQTPKETVIAFFDKESIYLEPEFSLRKLSEATGLPRRELSLVFSKSMDTTFIQYLNRRRIAHALTLLKENGDKITVKILSESCGYKSRASFYRHFEEMTGCTVTEYRKNE